MHCFEARDKESQDLHAHESLKGFSSSGDIYAKRITGLL